MSDYRRSPPQQGLPLIQLNPQQIPVRDQFEACRQATASLYESLPLGDTSSVQSSVKAYLLDQLVVGVAQFPAHRSLRTRRHLANGDTDYINLNLYLYGGMQGSLGQAPLYFAPDRVALLDFARPYVAIRQASQVLGVTIPRQLIRSSSRIYRQLPTFSWSLDSPQWRLLAGAMRRLWRDLPGIPLADAATVASEFLALLNGLLDQGFGDRPQPGTALDNSLGGVLRDYLTDNPIRPDLSVEHLVERFQCSRATLYRLFKEDGGVKRFVTDQRLARSFHDLASPEVCGQRVKDVAESWGFFNASHFNRLFRQRFDMTPSDVMADADDSMSPALIDCSTHSRDDIQRLNSWFNGRKTGE
jgi:AraC-like DNA-binding protein